MGEPRRSGLPVGGMRRGAENVNLARRYLSS